MRSQVDSSARAHRTTRPPPSSVTQRIAGAVARLRDGATDTTRPRSVLRPARPEQVGVLGDFKRYLAAVHSGDGVGVLIEGWNSPRCKLLIDLAPSLSRVRATQKHFRVLTRSTREWAPLTAPLA